MVTSFTDWNPNELYHFGTKGMKWGQRRFQNEDGSLTALGKERYGVSGKRGARGMTHDLNKLDRERATAQYRYNKLQKKAAKRGEDSRAAKKAKQYGDLLEKNKKMTDTILSKAKAAGMKVNTKEVNRIVNKGRTVGKNLIKLGVLAGGLYAGSQLAAGKGPSQLIRDWAQGGRIESKLIGGTNRQISKTVSNYTPIYATRKVIPTAGLKGFAYKHAGAIGSGFTYGLAGMAAASGIKKTKGTRYKGRKGG